MIDLKATVQCTMYISRPYGSMELEVCGNGLHSASIGIIDLRMFAGSSNTFIVANAWSLFPD